MARIIPLKSTRSDVIKILGEVQNPNIYRTTYHLKEGNIRIFYTNAINEGEGNHNLPDDTVYLIIFEPKPRFPLADLKIDLTDYKKFDPATPSNSGYEAYINKEEGHLITTYKGDVDRIDYFPDAETRKICPHCYDIEEAVRIILN